MKQIRPGRSHNDTWRSIATGIVGIVVLGVIEVAFWAAFGMVVSQVVGFITSSLAGESLPGVIFALAVIGILGAPVIIIVLFVLSLASYGLVVFAGQCASLLRVVRTRYLVSDEWSLARFGHEAARFATTMKWQAHPQPPHPETLDSLASRRPETIDAAPRDTPILDGLTIAGYPAEWRPLYYPLADVPIAVLRVHIPEHVPQVVIESRVNSAVAFFPKHYTAAETVPLAGDMDHYFVASTTKPNITSALQLLTPDVLQTVLFDLDSCDIELHDRVVDFVWDGVWSDAIVAARTQAVVPFMTQLDRQLQVARLEHVGDKSSHYLRPTDYQQRNRWIQRLVCAGIILMISAMFFGILVSSGTSVVDSLPTLLWLPLLLSLQFYMYWYAGRFCWRTLRRYSLVLIRQV